MGKELLKHSVDINDWCKIQLDHWLQCKHGGRRIEKNKWIQKLGGEIVGSRDLVDVASVPTMIDEFPSAPVRHFTSNVLHNHPPESTGIHRWSPIGETAEEAYPSHSAGPPSAEWRLCRRPQPPRIRGENVGDACLKYTV